METNLFHTLQKNTLECIDILIDWYKKNPEEVIDFMKLEVSHNKGKLILSKEKGFENGIGAK